MTATQQPVSAPGLAGHWGLPGTARGQAWQTPAPGPAEPPGPDEFSRQLDDLAALMLRFPLWFVWFQEDRWTATRYTGEQINGNSSAEIAATLCEDRTEPPGHADPLATGACPPPAAAAHPGEGATPPAAPPWQPGQPPRRPWPGVSRQPHPAQASDAA